MLASKGTVPSSAASHEEAGALAAQYSLEGRNLVALKNLKLTSF